jgi:anti-sigma-K factor RskA
MTTDDDIDATAGEYVLGTLDPAERSVVAARRLREPALDAAIRDWEQRLAPLDAETREIAPPAGLWTRIEQRLDASVSNGAMPVEISQLQRQVQRWRRAAIAATAIAASLVVAIGVREQFYRAQPTNFVGVFQHGDVEPVFYLTINLRTRELTLRPVSAERQPGKTYQLWIASSEIGPAPQSLGLVDDELAPTRKSLTGFDPALLRRATFGVSLEPEGGSPTGRPTSPALHAKLLPATID